MKMVVVTRIWTPVPAGTSTESLLGTELVASATHSIDVLDQELVRSVR